MWERRWRGSPSASWTRTWPNLGSDGGCGIHILRERGGLPAIHTETLGQLHARADARAVHVRLPTALFRVAASLATGAW